MLDLVIAPNPILRQVAATVNLPPSRELFDLANEMFKAMVEYRGIGLAAPQIGVSIRLMVIATPNSPTAYFNPEIVKTLWRKVNMEEGCLSLPGVFGEVRRPVRVYVRYSDLNGKLHKEWLEGLVARVYQHEVDHLNGVLFTDRTRRIFEGQELLTKYADA